MKSRHDPLIIVSLSINGKRKYFINYFILLNILLIILLIILFYSLCVTSTFHHVIFRLLYETKIQGILTKKSMVQRGVAGNERNQTREGK